MTGFLRLALPLIAFLSLFPLYTRYKAAAAPIPPGVYVAGLELSRYKDPAEIEGVIVANLNQPIAVYYEETRMVLRPQDISFAGRHGGDAGGGATVPGGAGVCRYRAAQVGGDPAAAQGCTRRATATMRKNWRTGCGRWARR